MQMLIVYELDQFKQTEANLFFSSSPLAPSTRSDHDDELKNVAMYGDENDANGFLRSIGAKGCEKRELNSKKVQ